MYSLFNLTHHRAMDDIPWVGLEYDGTFYIEVDRNNIKGGKFEIPKQSLRALKELLDYHFSKEDEKVAKYVDPGKYYDLRTCDSSRKCGCGLCD